MKNKNYFELASIQGELEGLAMGMDYEDFNKEGVVKALRNLSKKVKQIRKTETYETTI